MILIDKMKDLKIYRQKTFLPNIEGDKKNGSQILLLTPNFESSKKLINHPMFINKLRFLSYFLERDVSYYIGKSKVEDVEEITSFEYDEQYEYLYETKRSELPDSAFGLPDVRKYPLDTAEHVRSAIKLFGHCPEDRKHELAVRIAAAAKHFNIEIKENTQVYKYLHQKKDKEE